MGKYSQSDIDSFLVDGEDMNSRASFIVPPEVQAQRDGLRNVILNQELANTQDPAVIDSLRREMQSTGIPKESLIKSSIASLPAASSQQPRGKYSLDDIDAFLSDTSPQKSSIQTITPSQIKPGSIDYSKPLPQIRPDKVQVGALEGGGRGAGSGFSELANIPGLALGGLAGIPDFIANLFRDHKETSIQDAYFKNVYDPYFKNAVDYYAIKPNEELTTGGMVANTAGRMVAPILATIAAGGAPGMTALPAVIRGAAAAQPSFAVPATINRAQQLMEQGADLPSVAKASAANYGMNTLLGALPPSAGGDIVKRAVTGAALNVGTGAVQRRLEGAALGDENANLAQDAFSPQASGQDAILGSVMAMLFGPRAASVRPAQSPRVEPAVPDASEVVAQNTVQPQMNIADLISQLTGAPKALDTPDARAAQVKDSAKEHNVAAKELSKVFGPVVKDAESVYPQLAEQPYRYGDPASMQITTEQLRKYAPQLEANNIRSVDDPRAYGLIQRLEARDAAQSALPETTPIDTQGQGRNATDKEFGISAGIDSYLKQLEERVANAERRISETQGDRIPQRPFEDAKQESMQLRNRRAEDLIRQTQGARDANMNPSYRENIDGTQTLEGQSSAARIDPQRLDPAQELSAPGAKGRDESRNLEQNNVRRLEQPPVIQDPTRTMGRGKGVAEASPAAEVFGGGAIPEPSSTPETVPVISTPKEGNGRDNQSGVLPESGRTDSEASPARAEMVGSAVSDQAQPQPVASSGAAKKSRKSAAPTAEPAFKPVEQPKSKPAADGTTWDDLFKKVREETSSSVEDGVKQAKKLKPGSGKLNANPLPEMMTAARKLLISDEAADSAKNLASRIATKISDVAKGVESPPKKGEENIVAAAARATVSSIGTRLRTIAKIYDSPATEKLANMLQRQPGSGKEIAEPFGEAVSSRSKEFRNELAHPLEGKENWFGDLKKEHIPELQQVRKLVQNRGSINRNTEIGEIAKSWSSTLDNVLEYAKSKGLDVQKTEDFFPRVVDPLKIANPKMYAAFERDLAKVYEAGGASKEEALKAATSYAYAKRMQGLGVKENPFHDILGGAPKTKSMKHRVLAKAADDILAKYMVDNPFEALNDYVGGVVKAAEFESRRPMFEELRKQIKAEGNEHILGAVDNYLMGAIGPVKSSDAEKLAQTFSQTYATLKFLRLSSLVSLASEPFIMAQRVSTGPVSYTKNLAKAYGNVLLGAGGAAAKAWLGVDPSKIPGLKDTAQMQRFAEAIGTVANDMTHGIEHVVMADGIDDAPTSNAKIGKANQSMRHLSGRAVTASGLRRLTEIQHATMTKMASFFVKEMTMEYSDKKTGLSKRELRDMGVPDAQRDAFVEYVNGLESPWQAVQDKHKNPMARLYVQALSAIDRQGVQEPTRADKPIGNRHPLGTLVYSLTGFMHGFHNNVLARMARQGKDALLNQSGDLSASDRLRLLTPIAALPAAYAAQYGFTYLYDQIKGTPQEKQDEKDEPARMLLTGTELPWSKRTAEATSRLGLFGKYDPWVNMLTSARYGKAPVSGLIGPTYSSINDYLKTAMQTGTERDSENTNTHERLTAKLFYESLLDPAVDAASLAFGSPLTSVVAPQLMRRDETKNAFIDKFAGEKEDD